MNNLKKQISAEILAILKELIESEINISAGNRTVAEMAQEVLLSYNSKK